jgi:DNA-directed RNA polymerase I subunit RPA12
MSSVFCSNCASLILFADDSGRGNCSFCGALFDLAKLPTHSTQSKSRLFEQQRTRLKAKAGGGGDGKGAIVQGEVCQQCGNTEAYFKTAQLRSVDEGQTVFFECTRCGHARSENT